MATEKTPALFQSKMQFDYDKEKEKLCSRSTLSWIFAAVLIALLVVVTVEFLFYPPYEQRIRIYEEEPIELKIIPPNYEELMTYEKYPVPQTEEIKKPNAKANTWNFEFLIDPVELCATLNPPNSEEYERNPEVKLLMLVPSAIGHFQQRSAIRNTWGSIAERSSGPVRLGFVLGTTTNMTIENLVRMESLEYKDIIQADFTDSYHQLTTKSVLMLKWVAERCPHAQYFLKADDDTFVNIGAIANILSNEPYISQDKFIGGYIKNEDPLLRLPETEIYISVNDFPVEDYPPYASGTAYIMTIPTAIELFDAAQEVEPVLPQEDAYLTGLCAQRIQAALIHEPSFIIEDPPSPPSWDAFRTLATAHSVTPDILEQVWNEMTQSIANSMFHLESAINSTVNLRKKKNV